MSGVKVKPTKKQLEVIGRLRDGYRFQNETGRMVKPDGSSAQVTPQIFHRMLRQRMITRDPSPMRYYRFYILNDEAAWCEFG